MKLPSQFNTNDHDDMNDFSPIPAGDYIAQVNKSSMEDCGENAKDPNGKYIKLEFKILSGKNKGKLLWTNLNVINKNQQAVEIANKELKTICKAVGLVSITDTDELHGKPMKLKVSVKAATANQPARNEIKFYSKADGSVAAAPIDGPSDSGAESESNSDAPKKKPWE